MMPAPMPAVEQKFAAFINSLSPDEQRSVAPLMQTFSQTMAGPQMGNGGPDVTNAPPPLPPPGAGPPGPPPGGPPPPSAIPGGPPLPPPDPAAMSIGRQTY